MNLYRISRKKFISDLSGEGARKHGGRWNKKEISMLYTSEHESLAALEVLANTPIMAMPADLQLLILDVPESVEVQEIPKSDLPDNWQIYPPPAILADLGTDWITSGESLILKVPSAIIQSEFNYLINPAHQTIKDVEVKEIRNFQFDTRLISV